MQPSNHQQDDHSHILVTMIMLVDNTASCDPLMMMIALGSTSTHKWMVIEEGTSNQRQRPSKPDRVVPFQLSIHSSSSLCMLYV
jgi:hypothetical protein